MRPGPFSRFTPRKLLLWSAPLACLGCGGGGTDVVLPSLSITTSTSGVELDPDGYSVTVDGLQGQPIGPDATLILDRLSDGQHTLELAGLASNCVVAGENPRTVTVRGGTTTSTAFAITCSATSGTIEVTTTTSGPGSDPDGFTLILDGSDRGAIGASATASLTGLPPGTHLLGLTGLAANCQVVGENPRSVTVLAGQTAQIPFTVNCAAPQPGAGSLEITTSTSGSDLDPDGYTVRVDGGAGQPIGANATVTLANISASEHTVQLLGVAANCTVGGANPTRATVPSAGSARVAFAISCVTRPPGSGSIQITAATTGSSLDPDGYTVSVDDGSGQALSVNGSRTVENLTAGPHFVRLSGLAANCTVSGDNPRAVTITAGQTTVVTFTVACVATGPSLNLRIERMYLTQSTQTLTGDVPLVQGRAGYLRVFVTASGSNTARPRVRVRFFQSGAAVRTFTISAPRSSTPTAVQEGTLGSSWNVEVPASLIQANTTVLADVDPGNAIAETDETDNSFPTSGTPQALRVQAVPTAVIRFVRVLQTANGLEGEVGDPDGLMDLARRIYPLNGVQTDVRSTVFTASGPLQPNDENGQWGQILSDLEAARTTEAPDHIYFGVVRLSYGRLDGLVGLTLGQGVPTSLGWDDAADASRVVAHELGHVWGQLHTPCASPPNIDPGYPYSTGIGVYGFDVAAGSLKAPSTPDIMGYCLSPWISDYTYRRVLDFRAGQAAAVGPSLVQRQPALLVWGHIVNGRPVLEPSFQVVTRPRLPTRPGPYSIEATASDGTSLFNLSFDAAPMADDPRGSRHFAFAVPLDPGRTARLGILRGSGPGGMAAAATSGATAQLRRGAAPDSLVAQRVAGGVALKWNASAHPMIMVRDPDTGEVLSFARGGNARVFTAKGEVDLEVSDGVKSQRVRLAINRR